MKILIDTINDGLSLLLVAALLSTGLFFTVALKATQWRHFKHMFSLVKSSKTSNSHGISSFQSLCTGLAARTGTGNIIGVGLAVSLGGPGAVLWMWLSAFISMTTGFAESALAQLYKTKDAQGAYRGGPAYYIERGLGMRWLGVCFSVLFVLAFGLVFNGLQANAITESLHHTLSIQPLYSGLGLVLFSAMPIFGGARRVAKITEHVVPYMAAAYWLLSGSAMCMHYQKIPAIIALVVKGAFGWQPACAGFVGHYGVTALMQGVKRGLFSNEAGMGSAPNTAASAVPNPPHPVTQGYIQMLGVFLDTMVICTATAMLVLFSGVLEVPTLPGQLIQGAFQLLFGKWGAYFISAALFLFGFTTIIANYAYAESNLIFLTSHARKGTLFLKVATLLMVFAGALAKTELVWGLTDIVMALMTLTNLLALLLLSKTVLLLSRDYHQQRQQGKWPLFSAKRYRNLVAESAQNIWP